MRTLVRARPRATRAAPTGALLLAAVLVVVCWAALSPPWANDLVGGDEGYYGVMARNVAHGPAQWAFPSLSPLGPPGDKPPGAPVLIALSIGVLGPTVTAVRLPSLLAALVTLLATALLARRAAGAWAAWGALAVLATSPWFADASRWAAAEVPLTAFGLLALLVWTGGEPRPVRAFAAGTLVGLAFLCKLWLVAPFVIALLLALPSTRRAPALTALAAGFALPLLAHLALAAREGPAGLAHWNRVVLGFSLASRAGGEGYADYWMHGPLYYVRMLGHALLPALPLLVTGALRGLRHAREPIVRMPWAAWAGLVLLSLFRVKSGVYAYPLLPLFALLAAYGLGGLHARSPLLGLALAAVAVVPGGVRVVQRLPYRFHDTGYRDVCAAIAPVVASLPAGQLAIVAPEAPTFAFHTFRTCAYWGTPYRAWDTARFVEQVRGEGPRVFVVDPDRRMYGGWPDEPTVAWLESHAREITGTIARRHGTPLELRVFVRE